MMKKLALTVIVIWFTVGGIGHFWAPDFFVQIIPPSLPFRTQAVYITGFFELAGAIGLLVVAWRPAAGLGLILLTVAVTPANVYMWLNPALFPQIPAWLLALRLGVQIVLLAVIWWATQRR